MKALLIRDFLFLKRNYKTFLAAWLFYTALAFMSKNSNTLCLMTLFSGVVFTAGTLSCDARNQWERVFLSAPITRKQAVLGKYLLGMIVIVAAALLLIPAGLLVRLAAGSADGVPGFFTELSHCAVAALFLLCFLLPILFQFGQFGAKRERIPLFIAFFIPALMICFLLKIDRGAIAGASNEFRRLCYGLLFLPVVFSVSYTASVMIYQNKEIEWDTR